MRLGVGCSAWGFRKCPRGDPTRLVDLEYLVQFKPLGGPRLALYDKLAHHTSTHDQLHVGHGSRFAAHAHVRLNFKRLRAVGRNYFPWPVAIDLEEQKRAAG